MSDNGWHVTERPGSTPPEQEFCVWFGVVLIRDGLRTYERAMTVMFDRAREEARDAEAKWLKADAYNNFCLAELERLAGLQRAASRPATATQSVVRPEPAPSPPRRGGRDFA